MSDDVGPSAPGSLAERVRMAPVLAQPDLAVTRLDDCLGKPDAAPLAALARHPPVRALLLALADHAPFLWQLTAADPDRCAALLAGEPLVTLEASLDRLAAGLREPDVDTSAAMRLLRHAKQETALLIALADLGGVWDVETVTEALTRFADCAVQGALGVLVHEAQCSGKLKRGTAPQDCGLVVLALGKQGARELNYSSDIDLVVLFDPQSPALPETTVPGPFYVRLTQNFAKLLQERTGDGYVLRVDLRLRPDPASTPVAIGISSAFSYYETQGQNWERAAFIKARPVAGDIRLGERFLADLAPFIWRKYFDYAAIADIHAMKRQIHAVRGQAEIAVSGHNVKLGRGGIREIEFFVQTQQLIFGGRRPSLRGTRTLAMLAELQRDGWIDAMAVADLSEAYDFLRTIEHRLQMVADQQTQRLPVTEADLERFARFAGFAGGRHFADALLAHLGRVETHYARLFEHAPGLDAEAGNLVFTGATNDPDTLETLRALGFTRPEAASEIIRGWHFGRRPAMRSARAREVLTDLVPSLLQAFSTSGDPGAALAGMDSMLERISSAIELFSLLRSNAALRELLADILGSAPRLAETIAARPHVLDAAIDPALLRSAPIDAEAATRIETILKASRSKEDFLDRTRDVAQEELFLIGVRMLSGVDDPARSGVAYAGLAETIVRAALDRCRVDFAAEHGQVPGGACVVVGMGKFGSRELTATSDLDLIVIYRFDAEPGESNGPRPLDGVRYYTRLTQRLIAALTVPTRRGGLYDVDVRLRPSGRQGPLATQMQSFVRYQATEAMTWEHMALTRARVVAGDASLAADVEAAIRSTLLTPRDPERLRRDIADMRALIAREKGDGTFWDMKLAPGGLLDLEFVAQYIVLRFGPEHPSLLLRHPAAVMEEALVLGLLPIAEAEMLIESHRLQTTLTQLTRLTIDGPFDPAKPGMGVVRRLCVASNQPDLSALVATLTDTRHSVREIFNTRLGADSDLR